MADLNIRDLYLTPPEAGIRECTVSGWVRTVRDSKAFGFIELNDGTCFKNLQIVLEDGHTRDFASAVKITLGSAIRVTGELVLTPGMKQPFEVKASQVEVLGLCAPDFPLQKKRHSFEFLRTIAHLRPRTNTFYAVFRIRSLSAQLLHAFFAERGFVYVHTPIITTSDCEGAGEMFQVTTLPLDKVPLTPDGQPDYTQDFFGKQASLTVSGQ
ncbi:MAG TPA: asparagine--tRNA ligase, partial [Candidatus Limiplasma pullicola]|nr:asparagine--tRNA ligase [Candidatus Limiplasma pullicola]